MPWRRSSALIDRPEVTVGRHLRAFDGRDRGDPRGRRRRPRRSPRRDLGPGRPVPTHPPDVPARSPADPDPSPIRSPGSPPASTSARADMSCARSRDPCHRPLRGPGPARPWQPTTSSCRRGTWNAWPGGDRRAATRRTRRPSRPSSSRVASTPGCTSSPRYRRAVASFLTTALGGPLEPEVAGDIAAATPAERIPDGETCSRPWPTSRAACGRSPSVALPGATQRRPPSDDRSCDRGRPGRLTDG